VFVGQRKDPFAVNLGVIFDLINVPASPTSLRRGRVPAQSGEQDAAPTA